MRLETGRYFDDSEAFHGAPLAVVDRSAAELMWPGRQPLGQSLRLRDGRTFVVLGVVARVRREFADDGEPYGTALVTIDTTQDSVMQRMAVILRPDARRPANPAAIEAAAVRAVPGLTWSGTGTPASWERLVGQPRFLAAALGILAVLTALLAMFGILGVSHLVARRTREIGIRVALGADRGSSAARDPSGRRAGPHRHRRRSLVRVLVVDECARGHRGRQPAQSLVVRHRRGWDPRCRRRRRRAASAARQPNQSRGDPSRRLAPLCPKRAQWCLTPVSRNSVRAQVAQPALHDVGSVDTGPSAHLCAASSGSTPSTQDECLPALAFQFDGARGRANGAGPAASDRNRTGRSGDAVELERVN